MKFNARKTLVILLLLLAPTAGSMGAELSGLQIMQRAYEVYAGKDIFSRLSFTLKDRNDTEKKLGLLMAYKSYEGENGFHSKIIMFNQFPPDKKDISFLAWIYAPEQHKKDDMWLYLPELRTVRKLTHQHNANKHKHHDKDNDDEFSLSELKRFELQPRNPLLDEHVLLGKENIETQEVYKISSTPKNPESSPYNKIFIWVTTDHFLTIRKEYIDHRGTVEKKQAISWDNIGKAWVWEKVTAVNLHNGNETTLQQSNVKLNTGLTDNIFTKRFMKLGARSLIARVK